jgi:hypothetical protein
MPSYVFKGKVAMPVDLGGGNVISVRPGMEFMAPASAVASLIAKKLIRVLAEDKVESVSTVLDEKLESVSKSESKSKSKPEAKSEPKSKINSEPETESEPVIAKLSVEDVSVDEKLDMETESGSVEKRTKGKGFKKKKR